MKTFAALIRRYVLATAAIVLLVGGLLVGQIFYVGFKSNAADATGYRVGALADALKQTETGLQWGREHTPAEWMQGYAWAMVLDDNGNVIWQQDLPQKLNHRYTASEVAVFSHWYLADYPVQCWTADYGLFVVAEPVGTCWKYNIDMKQKMIIMLAKSIQPTMVELLLVVLGCCLFFSWRGSKSLQTVTAGLDTLAQGGTVSLPAAGFAGELAQKLNETSEQLRRRNEIIARRDTARTEWIAGVSHDIRTPLALILGWAEQLQREATLPAAARQKAGGICTQCEKIRSLIEDLNLTSKLQYGAQPLRRRSTQAGPFLRRVVAAFCENPLAARCTLDCSITPAVETAILHADAALLTRALENVLQNAVRHNAGPITLTFHADADETTLHLTIQDDGTGYPQSVLAVLNGEPEGENAPHNSGPACGGANHKRPRRQRAVCQPGPPRCKSDDAAATGQRRKQKIIPKKQIPRRAKHFAAPPGGGLLCYVKLSGVKPLAAITSSGRRPAVRRQRGLPAAGPQSAGPGRTAARRTY